MAIVTVDLVIRVNMDVPDAMEVGEAVSELNYEISGDEDDLITIYSTEIIDFEEIDRE